ncbi:MAG: hypothetical protein RSF02_02245 [Bacilli bacterium]
MKDNIDDEILTMLNTVEGNLVTNQVKFIEWKKYFDYYKNIETKKVCNIKYLIRFAELLLEATVTDIKTSDEEDAFNLCSMYLANNLAILETLEKVTTKNYTSAR